MKSLRLPVLPLLLAAAIAACASEVEPSGDFPAFWRQFSESVARDSEPDVRGLTRFPFMFEGREHDAAAFPRVYTALFDEEARDCLHAVLRAPRRAALPRHGPLPALLRHGLPAVHRTRCNASRFVFGDTLFAIRILPQ
jgi:hypothetical protein